MASAGASCFPLLFLLPDEPSAIPAATEAVVGVPIKLLSLMGLSGKELNDASSLASAGACCSPLLPDESFPKVSETNAIRLSDRSLRLSGKELNDASSLASAGACRSPLLPDESFPKTPEAEAVVGVPMKLKGFAAGLAGGGKNGTSSLHSIKLSPS